VTGELEVLKMVSDRFEAAQIPFMLTGSFAMAYYAVPRMTRDIDLVVALESRHVSTVVKAFSADFYIDADNARTAIMSQRLFNLMHLASGIKVDLFVRKDSEYRHVEFARRHEVTMSGVKTWIVSREDLILSKLLWAADSNSELQQRDVRSSLDAPVDSAYLAGWAAKLGVEKSLAELRR
jgi:hypothetical protein